MPADATLLSEVPLFESLAPQERELLAQQCEEQSLAPGERIFSRGDPGQALYIVAQGEVQLSVVDTTGQRIVFESPGPGDFFGELSLLDGEPRSADATALRDTRVVKLDRDALALLFRRQPDAALRVLAVIGRRLREADRLLRHRAGTSPNQAVEEHATLLHRIADKAAEFSGSFIFLGAHAVWFLVWIGTNEGWLPGVGPFDPFPFGLLTMVVSLEAIFLSCLVLISQNRSAAKERIRSEAEYEANIRAGLEVTQLHVKVDHFYDQVMARLAKLEQPPPAAVAHVNAVKPAAKP